MLGREGRFPVKLRVGGKLRGCQCLRSGAISTLSCVLERCFQTLREFAQAWRNRFFLRLRQQLGQNLVDFRIDDGAAFTVGHR